MLIMLNKQTTMTTAQYNKNQKGFTLIELLVVIGILAILLAIVLIAINPARQFQQANDTKRRSDVQAILNAIGSYAADNKGALPAGIPVAPTPAVDPGTTQTICHSLLGAGDTSNATGAVYISALPTDPSSGGSANVTSCPATGGTATGYTVQQDSAGRVTVSAPSTQLASPAISVTR